MHSLFLTIVLFSLSARLLAAEPDQAAFKAGIAVKVITPVEPLWMATWDRSKVADGKIHDLHVKALALEDSDGGKVVLLTADLLGMPRGLSDAVAEEVQRRTGL